MSPLRLIAHVEQCNPYCGFGNCTLFDVDCMTRQEQISAYDLWSLPQPPLQPVLMSPNKVSIIAFTTDLHWWEDLVFAIQIRLASARSILFWQIHMAAAEPVCQISAFTLARALAPAKTQSPAPSRYSHTRVGIFSNVCFQIYQSCDPTMLIMLCSMEGWMSIENSAPVGSELHVPRPQGDGSRVHTMHCPQDSRQEAGFHLCPSRFTGNQFFSFPMQAH